MGTSSVSSYEKKCQEQTGTRLHLSGGQSTHMHAHGGVDRWEHIETSQNNKPHQRTLTALTPTAIDKQVHVYQTWCQSK